MGLKRLAVVLQNAVMDTVSGLGPQVPGELPGGVELHADGAFAVLQNLAGFAAVEGKQVFEVEMVGADAGGSQLLEGFVDDALGGSPTDQGDVGVCGSFELRRWELLERER